MHHLSRKICTFPAGSLHPSAPHSPHSEPRLPREIPMPLHPHATPLRRHRYLLVCYGEHAERLHCSSQKAFHSLLPVSS